MDILMTVLYILLFIIFISVLIIIHELGHLTMAKVFKVYCMEFSIGMGPLLLKKKGKETQFSFRAIPFGGYVSMLGGEPGEEENELLKDVHVDPSRTLKATAKWKKAIIFVAGVVMNCVSAIVIFFIASWVPRNVYGANLLTFEQPIAEKIGISSGDYAFVFTNLDEIYDKYASTLPDTISLLDIDSSVYYSNGEFSRGVLAVLDYTDFSFKNTKIDKYLNFYSPLYSTDENGEEYLVISKDKIIDISKVDHVEINLIMAQRFNDEEHGELIHKTLNISAKYDEEHGLYYYEDSGIKTFTMQLKCKNLGESLKSTFTNFGNGATVVVDSFRLLFTDKEAVQSLGGIVAVGFTTTSTLQNYGWYYFLYLWGVISVNLAIINILPFPGLDGWHLLVIAVEGITKKEIPPKVKNVISFIGLAILVLLMVALLFKDVFKFIFNIGVFML